MGMRTHKMRIRIHYGDTDAGGVVYYANYLRFMEAGRYEYIREMGTDLAELQEKGHVFVVVEVEAKYHSPARLGDEIEISTGIKESTPAGLTFISEVRKVKDDILLFSGTVRTACLDARGRPTRVPQDIMKRIDGPTGMKEEDLV